VRAKAAFTLASGCVRFDSLAAGRVCRPSYFVVACWSDGFHMRNPCLRKCFRIGLDSIEAASTVFSSALEAVAAALMLCALAVHFSTNIVDGNRIGPDPYLQVSRMYASHVSYLHYIRLLGLVDEIHKILNLN